MAKTLEQIKQLAPFDRLMYWIEERECIRIRKEANKPKPWTADPILQGYRFCNVRREDDKVTRWVKAHWREPHWNNPHVWFAMVVARLVNWPDTLAELKYPVPWQPKEFANRMRARQERKEKLFTGAYMIHADAHHGGTKADYLAECVLTPLWEDRKLINAACTSLQDLFSMLREYRDMGEFMSGQVIADVKYTKLLAEAKDWWSWATPGPGSRRGLNRLLGREVKAKWTVEEWQEELAKLIDKAGPIIENSIGRLHAADWQNTLCEWDKYERVLHNEGRPRSKYPGV